MVLFLVVQLFVLLVPGKSGPELVISLVTSVIAMVTGMIVMTGIRLSGRLGYGSL
jgi:hypothetical protein